MARGYRRTRPALPPPPAEGDFIIRRFRALVRDSRGRLRRCGEDWKKAQRRGDRGRMARLMVRGKGLRKDFETHRRGLRVLLRKYGRAPE